MGSKVSDEWSVPLCFTHHRALHTVGNEEAWWIEKGIDAKAEALRLWRKSHGIQEPVHVLAEGVMAIPESTPSAEKESSAVDHRVTEKASISS
jgi:hypothetical protein